MVLEREITTLRDALAPTTAEAAGNHPPSDDTRTMASTSTPSTTQPDGDSLQRAVLQQRLDALLQRQRAMEADDPTLKLLKTAQRRRRRPSSRGDEHHGDGRGEGGQGARGGALRTKRQRNGSVGGSAGGGGGFGGRAAGRGRGGGRRQLPQEEEEEEGDMFADAAATRGAALLETERDNLIRLVCSTWCTCATHTTCTHALHTQHVHVHCIHHMHYTHHIHALDTPHVHVHYIHALDTPQLHTQGVVTPFDALHGFERQVTRVRMGNGAADAADGTTHTPTATAAAAGGASAGAGGGASGSGVDGQGGGEVDEEEYGVGGVDGQGGGEEDAFTRAARKFREVEAGKHRAKVLDVTEVCVFGMVVVRSKCDQV